MMFIRHLTVADKVRFRLPNRRALALLFGWDRNGGGALGAVWQPELKYCRRSRLYERFSLSVEWHNKCRPGLNEMRNIL
jgi:hypothetical protein